MEYGQGKTTTGRGRLAPKLWRIDHSVSQLPWTDVASGCEKVIDETILLSGSAALAEGKAAFRRRILAKAWAV
jgi:hypothetical protein